MDAIELHRRTVENWQRTLDAVEPGQWGSSTPCSEWDVRALVNHVVGEELWTRPLLEGRTIADVGTQFDGDVLGDDPVERGRAASTDAAAAADERGPRGEVVHLSFGDVPSSEYLYQLSADHLIHAWDLAAGTGQSRDLDAELVADVAQWFAANEEMYRSAGAIAAHQDETGDPQTDLLAAFGRRADWQE